MSLAAPEWLHLLWGVALLGVLRFVMARRHTWSVGTLSIWRRIRDEGVASRRTRISIPVEVVLEFAALLLLVAALASPGWTGEADVGPVEVFVAEGSGDVEAALGTIADREGVARDDADGLRVIPVRPVEGGVIDWRAAVAARPERRRWIVTRHLAHADEVDDRVGIEIVPPTDDRNVGIVAASCSGSEMFLSIGAATAASRRVEVAVDGARSVVDVAPGELTSCRIGFTAPPRDFEVRVSAAGDGDPSDDVVRFRHNGPAVGQVVVERGFDAFADALGAVGFEVLRAEPGAPAGEVALRVGTARRASDRAAILVPPAEGAALRLGDERATEDDTLTPRHPTWKDISLAGVRPGRHRPVSGGTPLLEVDGRPVIALDASTREIVLGFRPESWGWTGHASFVSAVSEWIRLLELGPERLAGSRWVAEGVLDPHRTVRRTTAAAARPRGADPTRRAERRIRLAGWTAALAGLAFAILVVMRWRGRAPRP